MGSDQNARDNASDSASDNGPQPEQPAETVRLNYIDKVHVSMTKQWDGMSRSLTVQIAISLITVAVCIGAVTPQEKFSLFGLGLTTSINAVLTGSAFLIATFHVMSFASLNRAARTGRTLHRLYTEVGYEDTSMDRRLESPFGAASPLYTLLVLWISEDQPESWLARFYMGTLTLIVFFGLAFALPVVAELAALIKVASLMGWKENLFWVVLLLPIVVSVTCDFWYSKT